MTCFLTLEELKQYRPKRDTYFVFGDPIGHSLSPRLHQAYFSLARLDGDYLAVRVSPQKLQEAIDCVKDYAKGVNLTIPLKEAVIPLLDDLSASAQAVGAVNTLSFCGKKVTGHNTDTEGIRRALQHAGVSMRGKRVLILGNGGAAKAMLSVAREATDRITVAGRNLDKVTAFCANSCGKPVLLSEVQGQFDIVLNGTSAGMGAQMAHSPLPFLALKDCGFLMDAIYNPLQTNFLTLGRLWGKAGINGLWMLLYQGLKAQEIWGNRVEDDWANRLFMMLKDSFTDSRKNIILTGFMGSGKTTVGREISRRTGMPFYDTDALLETLMGDTISHVFQTRGEAFFREQEAALAKNISALHGCVIATGGGMVQNPENIRHLRTNGTVFFLHPPFSEIKRRLLGDTTRPLLRDPGRTEALYRERLERYQSSCDHVITAAAYQESAGEILEIFHA